MIFIPKKEDVKAAVKILREANPEITQSYAYEALSKAIGFQSWNHLSAAMKEQNNDSISN